MILHSYHQYNICNQLTSITNVTIDVFLKFINLLFNTLIEKYIELKLRFNNVLFNN